jgi:hypothetical protein
MALLDQKKSFDVIAKKVEIKVATLKKCFMHFNELTFREWHNCVGKIPAN